MSERFARTGDGGVRVVLAVEEAQLLGSIPVELAQLYEAPTNQTGDQAGDPVVERLFPSAYLDPTAEQAEREWQDLVHPELVRERLASLERLRATLEAGTTKRGTVTAELGEDDVAAWLGVLNDARLALGTRLGITEELDFSGLDPDDPGSAGFIAYAWLTDLQVELVDTLLPYLPD